MSVTTMRNKNKKMPADLIVFIILEAILYLLFMTMDAISSFGDPLQSSLYTGLVKTGVITPSLLKYYAIIICLGISVLRYFKKNRKETTILTAAMFFTAVSDYFLLLNPGNILPGLVSFFIVHSIYLYVINNGELKKTVITVLIRIGVSVAVALALILTGILKFKNDQNMTALAILIILYGLSFVSNFFKISLKFFDKTKKDKECLFPNFRFLLLGLTLFILCDINVLIYNLDSFFSISSGFYSTLKAAASILMWGFYLPSQVLIVLSGLRERY